MPEDSGGQPVATDAQEAVKPTRFSLQFLQRVRVMSLPGAPSNPDRLAVLRALDEKTRSLSDSEGVLEVLLNTDDPVKHDAVDRQLGDVVREKLACRARFSAIDHGRPFKEPPAGEEQKLLEAINAVSDAIANTQRWEALLTAVDGLVQAYAAKDTKTAAPAAPATTAPATTVAAPAADEHVESTRPAPKS